MKNKIFGILQRIGRSFMLPIAILPVAGLLLGIGASLTNETMLQTYGLMDFMGPGTFINTLLKVMSRAGDIIFANLPLIFAMGIAIGMAKREKEAAALSAAIAFLIMHASISAMISSYGGEEMMLSGATAQVCGITSLQMGVFGGIMTGLGVAALHNRFYKIQLPQVLSFFGGTRFVPIISGLTFTITGILMFYIWPVIQQGIYAVGSIVMESGYAGTWIYGLMERALIPFGLHHVFYLPFWQTAVGGTMEIGGRLVEGAQNIFFAQLADPSVQSFSVSATRFMSGKFPLMIFGLPGAAAAMYHTAKPEKRKAVSGLLFSAAVTSMLTGITEPIEFTFLFAAPVLYVIHCVFAGLSYMLMHLFGVGVGMTFSGGLIDLFLFGILQGNKKTNWIWIVVIGIGYFMIYYVLFAFLIRKLNLKTPGREGTEESGIGQIQDDNVMQINEMTDAQQEDAGISAAICQGLGGKNNISDVDCCATRLRCTVYDPLLVNDGILKITGASAVIHKGNGVQVVYGPRVTVVKSNLEDYLAHMEEAVSCKKKGKPERKRTETIYTAPARTVVIGSPVSGIAADLSETPDAVFAGRMMGDGAMVIPEEDTVYAPEDGEVCFVFDADHAIGFLTDTKVSMLLHMGIDTVNLRGKGFTILVEEGEHVKKGTPLMRIDLEYVKKHAASLASPVLCTELSENEKIRLLKQGKIRAGEPLFAVDFYKE